MQHQELVQTRDFPRVREELEGVVDEERGGGVEAGGGEGGGEEGRHDGEGGWGDDWVRDGGGGRGGSVGEAWGKRGGSVGERHNDVISRRYDLTSDSVKEEEWRLRLGWRASRRKEKPTNTQNEAKCTSGWA